MQSITHKKNYLFSKLLKYAIKLSMLITVFILLFIISYITIKGIPYLKKDFFSLHYTTNNVSALPSIINTLVIAFITLLIATPIGIGSAIYLCEYAPKNSKIVALINLTTATLAGIPSIIYGLFGAIFFVDFLQLEKSILSGSLTLTIMVLPIIIQTSEEALQAVDPLYIEGSLGLGASKLRTLFKIILPCAIPGILSGIILSIGRMVGETAALIYTAGSSTNLINSIHSAGRTLAVHMYLLSSEGLYTNQTYAAAVLLILLTIFINVISNYIANKLKKG